MEVNFHSTPPLSSFSILSIMKGKFENTSTTSSQKLTPRLAPTMVQRVQFDTANESLIFNFKIFYLYLPLRSGQPKKKNDSFTCLNQTLCFFYKRIKPYVSLTQPFKTKLIELHESSGTEFSAFNFRPLWPLADRRISMIH